MIASRAAALTYSPEIVDVWKNQLVAGYSRDTVAGRWSDSKDVTDFENCRIQFSRKSKNVMGHCPL